MAVGGGRRRGGGFIVFCISAFTVPDFRNKSQWMETSKKDRKGMSGFFFLLGSMGRFLTLAQVGNGWVVRERK